MEISAITLGVISGISIIATSYAMAAITHAIISPEKAAKVMAYVAAITVFIFIQPLIFEIIKSTNLKIINPGHAGYNFFMPYWIIGISSIFIGIKLYKIKNTSNKSLQPTAKRGG